MLSWFGFGSMVFNATFNNILVISWWSVLLVQKTGVPLIKPMLIWKYHRLQHGK